MAHKIDELMTDEDFLKTIEDMGGNEDADIADLLKAMNENRIISWEEAERILQDTGTAPVKSSLPEQTRPSEPDNDTDVDKCIQKLLDNDPNLKEINLNNMKRTPIPQIRRLLEALAYNEYCERLSLANMGLYDNDVATLLPVIEMNQALKKLNLETNYLSGDFFAKLFKAALVNMTLEEIKAVNQGVSFATTAEKEIIDAVVANNGLTKVSVNLRLPEGRHKIENATLRNGEYKRILRREAALKAKQEAEELAKNPVPKLAKEPPKPQAKAFVPPAAPKPRPEPLQPKATPLASTASPAKQRERPSVLPASNSPIKKTPITPTSPVKKLNSPVQAKKEPEKPSEEVVKAKAPTRKLITVAPPPEPKIEPKRVPRALARRTSGADQSSTPILQIAGNTPVPKPSELRRTSNGTVKTSLKPAEKPEEKETTTRLTFRKPAARPMRSAQPKEEEPVKPKPVVNPPSEQNGLDAISSSKAVEDGGDKKENIAVQNGGINGDDIPAPKKKKIVKKKVIRKVVRKKKPEVEVPTEAS